MLTTTLPLYLLDASHPQSEVCAACEVRRSALFGALDDRSLAQIHATLAAPPFGPDERVFGRGEPGLAVCTVRAGIVRFERVTEGGDRRIARLAGRGDLIGQEALLEQTETWVADLASGAAMRRMLRLMALLDRRADEAGLTGLPRHEDRGAMLDRTLETASRLISRLRREGIPAPLPPRQARLDRARLATALADQDAG